MEKISAIDFIERTQDGRKLNVLKENLMQSEERLLFNIFARH
jgi:hypothetical protein